MGADARGAQLGAKSLVRAAFALINRAFLCWEEILSCLQSLRCGTLASLIVHNGSRVDLPGAGLPVPKTMPFTNITNIGKRDGIPKINLGISGECRAHI